MYQKNNFYSYKETFYFKPDKFPSPNLDELKKLILSEIVSRLSLTVRGSKQSYSSSAYKLYEKVHATHTYNVN